MLRPVRRADPVRGARRSAALALGVAVALAFAPGAHAADATTEARARDAYERGSIAYRGGEYARAAAEFAQADALAPNAVTLRAALDAATLADDPVLGTELLLRAGRAAPDRALASAIQAARTRFQHRVGRIVVRCPEASRCLATIDDGAVAAGKPRIVTVGVHTVTLQGDGPVEQRMLEVNADATVEVTTSPRADAPPAATTPGAPSPREPVSEPRERPEPSGLSPVWFFTALGVTAVAGGLTAWSAADTANQHTRFQDQGCDRTPSAPCGSLAGDGIQAERRTNAFLVGTAVLGVGTLALGVFAVRWGGTKSGSVGVVLSGTGAALRSTF